MTRALPLVLLLAAGCGGGSALPPAPAAVVTLDGKPAAGLSVRLHTADGTAAGGGN